jgi:serine phosphatase RsbU (regulator of sigma subunit)
MANRRDDLDLPPVRRSLPAPSTDEASEILKSSSFFAASEGAAIKQLASLAELVNLPSGDRLFDKGDVGTAMYFVVHGRVQMHNGEVVIGHLGPGAIFGEVAALSQERRSASVTAVSDTVLLKLEQDAIYATLAAQPGAARSLIEALCAREREIIDEKFDRIIETRVLERELEIGQRIQRNFLPETIPVIDGWGLDGLLRPARKVAGDFFDFFLVPDVGRVGIVIGDVCDKGVGAALFMSLFRSLIRSGALHRYAAGGTVGVEDPATLLRRTMRATNQYITSTHPGSSIFASVFFGLLEPRTGEIAYVNAGHEAPVIAGPSGIRVQLEATGPVIGLIENLEHAVGEATLSPGELLFGYTDGATDARNEAGQPFGEERLLEAMCRGATDSSSVLQCLLAALDAFSGRAEQYDDITMICLQRHPDRD